MRIADAAALAHELMTRHGLVGWRLVFDNAKTRAGVCRPARREIGLSRVLTQLHDEADVRDTILHEIAHALVGPEHGHDAVWREAALRIGCSGQRCVSADAPRPPAPWVGTCPAGHEVRRFRRPERVQACARCSAAFDARHVLTWRYRGRSVVMPATYAAELARIRSMAGAGAAAEPTAARSLASPAASAAALGRLPAGSRVVLLGQGRYAGLTGEIVKRGRTRYHVQTPLGLVTAPFSLVRGV